MSQQNKLSRYHVASEAVADQNDGGRVKRVVFSTRSTQVRVIDESLWAVLQDDRLDELPAEVAAELATAEILVPAEENEADTILGENDAAVGEDRSLYLVVQPTAWCQLGCTYCGQGHTRDGLCAEQQELLVRRVRAALQTGGHDSLRICWFGGEPLVGLAVMRALSREFQAVAAECGCPYSAKLVSNGLMLTPEVAAELVHEMKVDFIEVTIDGTAEFHDRRRNMKTGKGSFDRIFRNVVALALRDDLKVQLSIRCNVDRQNRDGVIPLLHQLAAAGIHRRIARFYTASVFNWGNDAGDKNASTEEFAQWELEWLVAMFKLGFDVPFLAGREKMGCMAQQSGAELVDPQGLLFNCGEVSLVPVYETELPAGSLPIVPSSDACGGSCRSNRYAVGDLAHGADPERKPFGGFRERIRRGEYPCRECAVLPLCGGSCAKKWEDGETPCPPMKYNMPARLLLAYAAGRIQNPAATEA
jgi:uncharacterized protein